MSVKIYLIITMENFEKPILGATSKGHNESMKKSVRRHPIGIWNILRNKSYQEEKDPWRKTVCFDKKCVQIKSCYSNYGCQDCCKNGLYIIRIQFISTINLKKQRIIYHLAVAIYEIKINREKKYIYKYNI